MIKRKWAWRKLIFHKISIIDIFLRMKSLAQFQVNRFPILLDILFCFLIALAWLKWKLEIMTWNAVTQRMRTIWPHVKWIILDWKFDGFAVYNVSASNERVWVKTSRGCRTIFQLPESSCLSNVNLWDYSEKETERTHCITLSDVRYLNAYITAYAQVCDTYRLEISRYYKILWLNYWT